MVKIGYKETEIGVIPEDWEVGSIKNFGHVLNGGTPNTSIKEYWNGDILWCTPTDITKTHGFYIDKTARSITQQGLSHSGANLLPKHSILLCSRATIGELKINSIPLSTNQGFKNILMNNCTAVTYLFYLLQTKKKYMIEKAIGSTFLELSKKALCEIQLQVPPILEQKRIADALSDADTLISSLEKLIEKKKAIKKGVMQQLLTGKIRLPGFSGEWETYEFGKIFDVYKGKGLSKNKVSCNGQYNCILYGELFTDYTEIITHVKSKTTCREGFLSLKYDILMPGSTTTIGLDLAKASVLMLDNVLLGGDIVIYRRKQNIDTRLIGYLIPTLSNQIIQFVQGITIIHLQSKELLKLTIKFPTDKKEQTAIANILCDMENEIADLEQKLNKYRQIKQGMMQKLLTGRIRLISRESENAVSTQTLIQSKGHNQKIDDAVVIGAIVDAFYSDKYPLGRKKVQKLLYLLRRKQDASVDAFKKKAAGPYADEVRYKGGEPIAIRNQYVKTIKTPKGTVFVKGEKIDGALHYIDKWQMQSDFDWLASQFKYTKTDELELLATIDMAMRDLDNENIVISVDMVKELIHSNKEWTAKLSKSYFSDENIAWAIDECRKLFKAEG